MPLWSHLKLIVVSLQRLRAQQPPGSTPSNTATAVALAVTLAAAAAAAAAAAVRREEGGVELHQLLLLVLEPRLAPRVGTCSPPDHPRSNSNDDNEEEDDEPACVFFINGSKCSRGKLQEIRMASSAYIANPSSRFIIYILPL